jgi:hypothetical protein
MRPKTLGKNTSLAEVTNVDTHGIWILVKESEYFMPYEDYPWFKDAILSDILEVALLHENHLHWPKLDVDLSVESLTDPERYPLLAE